MPRNGENQDNMCLQSMKPQQSFVICSQLGYIVLLCRTSPLIFPLTLERKPSQENGLQMSSKEIMALMINKNKGMVAVTLVCLLSLTSSLVIILYVFIDSSSSESMWFKSCFANENVSRDI